ncbi:MAG: hypothetical protein IPO62_04565 [Saprospiraceae bacterium]|nr:hypothetical protein [Saprospiraceae bacterium]
MENTVRINLLEVRGKHLKQKGISNNPALVQKLEKNLSISWSISPRAQRFPTQVQSFLLKRKFDVMYRMIVIRGMLEIVSQETEVNQNSYTRPLNRSFDFLKSYHNRVASHLLESVPDLRFILELLGQSRRRSTVIYSHVSIQWIQKIKSAFDDLYKKFLWKYVPLPSYL